MKNFLLLMLAGVLGIYLIENQIMDCYKPSIEVLRKTTLVSGKLVFITRRGGTTPELNGIPLMCGVSFLGPNDDCTRRIRGLTPGTNVVAAIASVPTFIYSGRVAMSIVVNGEQIYVASPEQVIDCYIKSSRSYLSSGPFFVLLLGLLWLWFSDLVAA